MSEIPEVSECHTCGHLWRRGEGHDHNGCIKHLKYLLDQKDRSASVTRTRFYRHLRELSLHLGHEPTELAFKKAQRCAEELESLYMKKG